MFEVFKEINWSLLGALVVVSALVAWAGDVVGMKLGRKRITFLSLRPKYTSRIISMITGTGIALVTMLVISVTSEPVRTALFSMNYVQNQITNLTAELQKNRTSLQGMEIELFQSKGDVQDKQEELLRLESKLSQGTKSLDEARKKLADMKSMQEKTALEQAELHKEKIKLLQESKKLEDSVRSLKSEAENLKAGIQRLREGRIAALTGENLAQGVTSSETLFTAADIDQAVRRLSEECKALLAYRFGIKPDLIKQPDIDRSSIDAAKKQLLSTSGRYLLRLVALTNAVEGEPVMAELEVYKTTLIFKAKSILAEKTFSAGMSRQQVEDMLFRTLRDVNSRAVKGGVLRDPLSGNVGSMDTSEFMDAVEKITGSKYETKLLITAAEDIFTEGPVKVKFEVK